MKGERNYFFPFASALEIVLDNKRSAGGQLEQPCEVNSSRTTTGSNVNAFLKLTNGVKHIIKKIKIFVFFIAFLNNSTKHSNSFILSRTRNT